MQTDAYTSTSTKDSPEDVRRKAEETAHTVVDQAQQVAATQANTQMTRAADLLDGVVQSLNQTSQGMRDQQPQVASVTDQAATRVQDVSNYLRNSDFNRVVRDAENYARREPLIFLGAAFAVGFIAARFLKASSPSADFGRQYGTNRQSFRRYEDEYGYGSGYGAGYGRTGYGTGYTPGSEGGYSGQTPGSAWSGGSAATGDSAASGGATATEG
jgi:ElaB/YqjD/DUF883 family membrane-anchored ribosome-binding protein